MEGGPPGFARSSTSSVLLWNADSNGGCSQPHTGLSPSMAPLSRGFCLRYLCNSLSAPGTPRPILTSTRVAAILAANARAGSPRHNDTGQNRAGFGLYPFSLAATNGVSVDFLSCRYLDVSVPCVRFCRPMHSAGDDKNWLPSPARFPHWEIPGLTVARHLPRAYRSQPRPSSPLDA